MIHADEAVFHQRIVIKKSWANKGLNITPTVMLHYEPCQAAVGFVSAMRGAIYFDSRPKSIKSADFLQMLKIVRAKSGKRSIVILLDNASIHRTLIVKEYCARNKIAIAFNVAYAPWFNGIEEVWA